MARTALRVVKISGLSSDFLSDRSAECTKIAHRRSLAIFAADEGIAGNYAARAILSHFIRRRNRGSLAIFFDVVGYLCKTEYCPHRNYY